MDLLIFSEENLLKQIQQTEYKLGFYKVKFYVRDGSPSTEPTEKIEDFFLYPSGGTLRNKDLNIVTYMARFDTYRGFVPPHLAKL